MTGVSKPTALRLLVEAGAVASKFQDQVRMNLRRYTRLTNAFSRKLENHAAVVALYYFSYNFVKIHRTLRTSPAIAAGVVDRLMEVSDLVALPEAEERGLERSA